MYSVTIAIPNSLTAKCSWCPDVDAIARVSDDDDGTRFHCRSCFSRFTLELVRMFDHVAKKKSEIFSGLLVPLEDAG